MTSRVMTALSELRTDTPVSAEWLDDARKAIDTAASALTFPKESIGKYELSDSVKCPRQKAAKMADDKFEMSIPMARGAVNHKAIELSIHYPDERAATPPQLVDIAIEALREDEGVWLNQWLCDLDDATYAKLAADCTATVTSLEDTLGRIKKQWRPVVEMALRTEFDGWQLSLKTDLQIGQLGEHVLADWKNGKAYPEHLNQMRWYCLVSGFRNPDRPPAAGATVYLGTGQVAGFGFDEQEAERGLHSLLDALEAFSTVDPGDVDGTPANPSPLCGWCDLKNTCPQSSTNGDNR